MPTSSPVSGSILFVTCLPFVIGGMEEKIHANIATAAARVKHYISHISNREFNIFASSRGRWTRATTTTAKNNATAAAAAAAPSSHAQVLH